jgi:TonB-linked SusC/RagA family outer membrane protein
MLYTLIPGFSFAQQTITGTVLGLPEKEPLPGVSILIKGTSQGTVTNTDGTYNLAVPSSNAVLVFTFVGYLTEEIQVGNQSTINISLSADVTQLGEVVVVGYGTQLKTQVTGSIATIKSSEITKTPVTRIEQALQGRAAGVQVTNQSGQPGDQPQVRIRGIGTNGNADPLYVVDGFPVGGIDYLNPADIESINVLKDAASAAIYGARGANGVVLITTKTGKRNEKIGLTYDGYYGIQNAWRQMPVLNAREYAVMMNEGAANAGVTPPFANPAQYGEGTDWQKEVFTKNAPMQNHQFTVSGGTKIADFASTLSYFNQNGIVGGDKSKFERYTFRTNANFDVTKRLKTSANIAYTRINRTAVVANQEFGGIVNNALNIDPLTPLYETDTTKLKDYNVNAVKNGNQYYGISSNVGQEVVNPLARLAVTNGKTRVDKFVGNIAANYEFFKGLTFRSTFGLDLAYVTGDNFNPVYYLNAAQQNNINLVSKSVDWYQTWQAENTLEYKKVINDKHDFTALIGTTALKHVTNGLFGSKTGLPSNDPQYAYLNLAAISQSDRATGGYGDRSLFSYFGRLNYAFQEKYLFTAIIRRDASSRFGANNKYATFPSLSAGWIISNESFLSDVPAISFLKVRASWGQNGNEDIGNEFYPWVSSIGSGRGYSFYNGTDEVFTGGAAPARPANPDIKWEASEQTNIGVDLSLWQDRISITTDYYIKTTKDWLVAAPIAGYLGYQNAPYVNGGTIRNKGVEFAINYNNNIGDFKYSLGFNMSHNKNEVTEIQNAEGIIAGPSFATFSTVSRSEVGYPVAYFYGLKTSGIFQNQSEVDAYTNAEGTLIQPLAKPGDVRFVDNNNDGKIDATDRTNIGNPTPTNFFGFNLSASYKGFDFSAFFNGVTGNDILNGTKRHDLYKSNMPAKMLNRWTGEGTSNTLPRFTWNDANGNWTNISQLYIEDGSFLRLKNVQLGYNVPATLLTRAKIEKVRLYVSGENLLTFTKYTGLDPEVGGRGTTDIGIDRGLYPQARTFRLGLNVTF